MTAEAARDILCVPGSALPSRPVAFDGLFGWFSPGATRRGVVLCGTLGFEQLSAYRAWRALAEAIAATGCATLRFDYPGEGDSGDAGAGRVAGLVAAVRRAIRYLREEAGAAEIVLVGLRFGGTLAALAAREGGVDRLVLLAPFATGKAYLREMRLQARTTVIWPGGVPLPSKPGTLNVQGFVLQHDLMEDIKGIDVGCYAHANVPDLLIIDQAPPDPTSSFAPSGITIERQHFARFDHLLSGEMNLKPVSDVIEAFRELNKTVAAFSAHGARDGAAGFHLPSPTSRIAEKGWREEASFLADGLFGVRCQPDRPSARDCLVLFVNVGTYVRSGPSRYMTRLARTLAVRGVTSFRIDLKGMGDSAAPPTKIPPVYQLDALEDVRSAIDRLRMNDDADIILVGMCSGAYLAFHMICQDERVSDAILANLYCFDWPSDVSLETALSRPTVRDPTTYAKSLLNSNTWRRLLTGQISVLSIVSGVLTSWPRYYLRRFSSVCRLPFAASGVLDRVANVRRRDGRFKLVYSASDPGILNVQGELGLSVSEIERVLGSSVAVIEGCDHNFSTPEAQDRIASILIDMTDQRTRACRSAMHTGDDRHLRSPF